MHRHLHHPVAHHHHHGHALDGAAEFLAAVLFVGGLLLAFNGANTIVAFSIYALSLVIAVAAAIHWGKDSDEAR